MDVNSLDVFAEIYGSSDVSIIGGFALVSDLPSYGDGKIRRFCFGVVAIKG